MNTNNKKRHSFENLKKKKSNKIKYMIWCYQQNISGILRVGHEFAKFLFFLTLFNMTCNLIKEDSHKEEKEKEKENPN